MERAVIRAGEQAGSLDEIFKSMSDWFEFLYRLKTEFVKRLLYPLFIFHFAAFVIPFPAFFTGGTTTSYLTKVILILSPFYALAFFAVVIAPFLRKTLPPVRGTIDIILVHIPLLSRVIIKLDMLRFCTAFRIAFKAGVSLKETLLLAAETCTNLYTRHQVSKLQKAADKGEPLYEHMKRIRIFPEIMIRMFETGEKGGKLEEATEKIEEYFSEEVMSALSMLIKGLGILIYLIIIGFIAYNIITMAMGTIDRINEIGNGKLQ